MEKPKRWALMRSHAKFQATAGEVARLVETGRRGDAFTLLEGVFAERSDKLIRALCKWRGEA